MYIATLDGMGVSLTAIVPLRSTSGGVICHALRGGTSVGTLVDMTTSDGVYSRDQANVIIGAADGALCPDVNLPPN